MSLELGMWNIDGNTAKQASYSSLDSEKQLEDFLVADIKIASSEWALIGQQVYTDFGGYIDLLAIDSTGKLIILELKRGRTPREVVAQTLDYASWVKGLTQDSIVKIYEKNRKKLGLDENISFGNYFETKFNGYDFPEELGEEHEIVIVASKLDDSTERIIHYLSETYRVPINGLFFRIFQHDDHKYLTRAWLRDPYQEVDEDDNKNSTATWNGAHYVSLWNSFNWDLGRKYGFVVAGGGERYRRSIGRLTAEDKIWVNWVGHGYVGVGTVLEPAIPSSEFTVNVDGNDVFFKDIEKFGKELAEQDGTDTAFDIVRVKWEKALSASEVRYQQGLFGNQNVVCRPRSPKWEHTVSILKKRFGIVE